ncbi:TetR/AcrR family transcriptional regulator [Nordella sp. HKS 07]|uniref:TetR/AcrR family transcriptional regulator n=1 Tax=Nordella sp. HKS 07 TaxID=2712222 RepID=UPI0013E189FE|nr:TetR/AcrR family transcriptional regulator [Nordella sp. HKS 07]QIG50531.1 TetR/AcrR family transcriptional regulator [Nordella sp. HKS 07]
MSARRPGRHGKATPPPQATRPLRADAQRNRDRLVEVAGLLFAQHGIDTSLEQIAERARVGIGTLYRHFPTREHLVEAVYRHEVEALCQAAEDLARKFPPDKALAEWMRRFVDYIAAKRGMANSLKLLLAGNSEFFAEASGKIPAAVQGLVDAAIAQGSIRSDIDSSDVLHALSGIYNLPQTHDWRERSRRLITLLMDGLRSGARKPEL